MQVLCNIIILDLKQSRYYYVTSLYWTLDLSKADVLGRVDVNGNMGFA